MTERSPEDVERRLRAKRWNESLKLTASTLNTIGLTLFGTAIVVPLVAGGLNLYSIAWIIVAASLHFLAHVALGRLRSED